MQLRGKFGPRGGRRSEAHSYNRDYAYLHQSWDWASEALNLTEPYPLLSALPARPRA